MGKEVVKIAAIKQPIPARVALLAGDAAHNLRSALDHLAYRMVPIPDRNTAFPIWGHRSRPTTQQMESLVGAKVGGATKQVRQALRAMEPYLGGSGQYLWVVNELDVVDKHRLLLTMGASYGVTLDVGYLFAKSLAAEPSPVLNPKDIPSFPLRLRPADRYPLRVGSELRIGDTGTLGEQEKYMKVTLDVAFGEPEVLEGEPVVPTLTDLANRVERLIETLIKLL